MGSTVLTSTSTFIDVFPDSTAIANEEPIQITGFTFDGNNSLDIFLKLRGASGISGTKPYRYVLIGDNMFRNGSNSSSNGVITAADANDNGQIRGVIYHNTFDRIDVMLRIFSNNDTREWANTAFNQFSYGTEDNLYFEDNTIQYSSSFSGPDSGWIESGQGGRIVARFNNYNMANTSTSEIWDVHGFQNWNGQPDSGQTGTMVVEYYNNTFSNATQYRWINHRGSWGMFFDNTATGSGGLSIDANQYVGCPSDISPPPTNYNPVINNTYVFNNTKNGANVTMQIGDGNNCGIAENSNFWNYTSRFNGTVGVGMGPRSAMPSTCTTGVGYWVTDEGSWNTNLPANTSGQFYKCVSTNTWRLYYTPYTYPHPLRTGGGDPPAPPTDLTAVGQ
jgi:hypothetical protein